VVESLLVTDNLDSNRLARAMISALKNLAERTLAQRPDDFVAIRKVIPGNYQIVASLVVITIVVGRVVSRCRLLFAASTNAIHVLIVEDLPSLVLG
jgi:hypothetical protein